MPSRYEKYATHHTSRRTDEWDYTQSAAYFVTICTEDRACLFGEVRQGRMISNRLGRIVMAKWKRSEEIRDRVHLDVFVVMPNHLHGIVVFADPDVTAPTCPRGYRAFGAAGGSENPSQESNSEKASHCGATLGGSDGPESGKSDGNGGNQLYRPPRSLGSFVAGFKSAVTTRINDHWGTPGTPVWQRNYHDVIIQDERHWRAARRYIRRNPADWGGDRLHRKG